MMMHKNPHYELRITRTGLVHLTVGGQVILDRGALHEFLDMSERVEDDGTGDRQRETHHHIQEFSSSATTIAPPAKVERIGRGTYTIAGVLATAGGLTGVMHYRTDISVDNTQIIKIRVVRRYLQSRSMVVDDSLCFLAPPSFAKSFHVYSPSNNYEVMDDEDITRWYSHPLPPPALGAQKTSIPRRLRAMMPANGYGVLMGEGVGFGLILDRYFTTKIPRKRGEFRAHRPRPPAELKFDELEFQWAPTGPRPKGTVEWATFRLIPCRDPRSIHEFYEKG